MGEAARRWAAKLEGWAIPPEVLEAAPESPWGFPPALFAVVDRERAPATPSWQRAAEAVPPGGSVLDVGAGGGAAGIPLAPPASLVVAVDESEAMLVSFAGRAGDLGIGHAEVQGRWPDVADRAPVADVVVCHHVFYNVADLAPFALALTAHARRRVVVELSSRHPLTVQHRLWRHFHGQDRPSGPGAEDAVALLGEVGIDANVERFERAPAPEVSRSERVAFLRRRLCLPPDREAELDELLGPKVELAPTEVVTLWWDTPRHVQA